MTQSKPILENDTIGTYQLETLLGKGGMGSVFKSRHTRLGRIAAIKILSESLSQDEEYVSRFFHEAKVVNAIGHPNIVDIIDFIEQEKPRQVAYVMELIEGPSLAKGLENHRFSLIQTLNIAEQIAAAMSAAHGVGVIHRDLKPDNVLLIGTLGDDFSQRPSVKVVDFGIAKSSDTAVRHQTVVGTVMGTPAYMAPEQVAALPTTPAVDVFALGEILYELLIGERLFTGSPLDIMQKKVGAKIPSLRLEANYFMKNDLEALVNSCLSFRPNTRPSMEYAIKELTQIRRRLESELPTNSDGQPSITNVPLLMAESHGLLLRKDFRFADKLNLHFLAPKLFVLFVCLGLGLGATYLARTSKEGKVKVSPIKATSINSPPAKRSVSAVEKRVAPVQAPKVAADILVSSNPAGASLHIMGQDKFLGTTPLNLSVSKRNKYVLRLTGFRAKEVDLGPTTKKVHFKLIPVSRQEKPRKRISRPTKREPEPKKQSPTNLPEKRRKALKKSEVPAW